MTTASLLVIDYLNQMGIAYADPDNPDFNKFVESEKAALLLMETGMIGMGIGLISGIFTYYITDLIVS